MTGLVGSWERLQPYRAKPFFMVRLLDLEVAFSKLPLDERRAVFCMGFAQLTAREAALVLSVHFSTVARWYIRGLDNLVTYMNGAIPD